MGGFTSPEQQYALRWNDFQSSMLTHFRHLRDEEDFVDVTLACDGCSFTAHKVVLSACSPYFKRLLKANPCQHPIVILRDVQEKDMESLLRFMYNGEVHIGQERLSDFIKTAQMLQVRGLADVAPGNAGQRLTTAPDDKISPTSSSLPWATDRHEPRNEDVSSPPTKRARSSDRMGNYTPDRGRSPARVVSGNNGPEAESETLLGQALEGSGTPMIKEKGNSESSIQAQSTGEDSNSSDTAMSDHGDDPVTPKTEPSEYPMLDDHHPFSTNGGIMDPTRGPGGFHNALLGLQGLGGLMPGPSGMHNSPDNFDASVADCQIPIKHREHQFAEPNYYQVGSTIKYECPLCEAILMNINLLRRHIDEHYPSDSHMCPVPECAKTFTHPNSVRNHMRAKHSKQWEIMKSVRWNL
ncbi:protein abrupt isoform X3 [Diabrotica virgifera virgifera]|uniref:Protein abrupt-like isoform X3 n=1 Tax=Diabrotica virgifera virgifera TaxID=50390 RepID=A0A6P7FZ59_DIAVI|nr:protein abrupt isoform X3 [Diabrotica virgifera virgifera]